MLKILLLTILLLLLAVAGLAIRMLFDRKAEFKGSSCNSAGKALQDKGISCGCGAGQCKSEGVID
jgi:hypothetical protein